MRRMEAALSWDAGGPPVVGSPQTALVNIPGSSLELGDRGSPSAVILNKLRHGPGCGVADELPCRPKGGLVTIVATRALRARVAHWRAASS